MKTIDPSLKCSAVIINVNVTLVIPLSYTPHAMIYLYHIPTSEEFKSSKLMEGNA